MAGTIESVNTKGSHPNDPFRMKAIADLFNRIGPVDQFLAQLLATQCRAVNADAAVVLRIGEGDRLSLLAAHPPPVPNGNSLDWVARIERPSRKVMASGASLIIEQEVAAKGSGEPSCYLIIIPIHNHTTVRAVAAFRVKTPARQAPLASLAHLETTALLLDHYELHQTLAERRAVIDRLERVFQVLTVVNRSNRFLSAAMSLCNEIATRFVCSRVSLGFLNGRCVHVQAISHTDAVNRKMKLIQDIEAAMEECLDQDVEVIYPAADTAMVVSRATATLCESHGPSAALSLPIRQDGEVIAVMALERPLKQPFDRLEEIEVLRLICDLSTPRLCDLRQRDRWFGAQMACYMRQPMAWLLGPERTWIKVAALLLLLTVVVLTTVKGDFRIDSAFSLKAQHQQAVVAPFNSFFKDVLVAPGDQVEGSQTILGTLETAELRLNLAAHKAERLGYQKQMTAAMRDRKTADAQIAKAQSDKLAAEIHLIERKIDQATLVAPITGWIVSEDLKQQIGAPVETGKILFEIAGIDTLWAQLYVPESAIANIAISQTGELACVGHPDEKIPFVIQRIDPIAEIVSSQNVFRVRARLDKYQKWMRPGMQGKARISAGKRSYLWIATHRLVNWLRMKLWI